MNKKHTLILLGLCIPAFVAHAQSWCPPGAQWKYDTGNPWVVSQTLLTYAGDSVVDGYTAQKIDRILRIVEYFGNDTLIDQQSMLLTRTDGDIVWDRVNGVWDTLFWFGAVHGDEWQPSWPFEAPCPDHVWHVTDTTTVVIDGVSLRKVFMEMYDAGVGTGEQSSMTERIGGGSWQGLPPCDGVYECYCSFICYQDDDIAHPSDSCVLTLSVPGVLGYPLSELVIMPDGEDVRFKVPAALLGGELVLLDALGKVLLNDDVVDDEVRLMGTPLAPGMYTVLVRKEQMIAAARYVKR